MHDATVKEWRLRSDLAGALDRDELAVYYQPIVDAASGRIVSAEALIRWIRGDDLIEPAELIRVAEETGLISRVGAFTLQHATRRCREWRKISPSPISVAVNLSARQLQDESIVADVNEALAETGLDPGQLELELTETTMLEREGVGATNLLSLWRLGVRLAIDDFGTGYSSLGYLRHFRFDTIKICQDFTARLSDDADSAALARNVIRLAHDFELRVTAEGVEDQSQLDFLRSHGCDRIQGFLAAPPLPAEDFAELLRSGQTILPSEIIPKPPARFAAAVANPSLLPRTGS
jgi:EAL domain-containing protein (putative c-di-GMP-specific phosphodiesterase class I)